MKTQSIYSYQSGKCLGRAEIDETKYQSEAQWPQGIIYANNILSPADVERFNIYPETVIYSK